MPKKPKRKPGSGGPRPGAGKPLTTGEQKVKITIRVYPAHKKAVIAKYGTFQAGIDQIPT